MNDRRLLLLLLAAAAAAAGPSACRQEPPPLAGARMGGPFTLTDQNGRRVNSDAFAGKYRIVYFGYTFCPDVCPVDLQLISGALRRFEESDPQRAARVVPIFITTDPARDTPAVLREFAGNFHPRLVALTGGRDDVGRVARAHGVYFEARPPAAGAQGYLVDHNRIAVLYGPEGEPIAILPHDRGPAGVLDALERWVK
jgi:protein SCO1/2